MKTTDVISHEKICYPLVEYPIQEMLAHLKIIFFGWRWPVCVSHSCVVCSGQSNYCFVIVFVFLLLLLLLIEMWPCGLWRVCDSHSTAVCSVQWQAAVKLKDLFDYFVSQPYCQITKFSTKNSLNQKIPFAFLIL